MELRKKITVKLEHEGSRHAILLLGVLQAPGSVGWAHCPLTGMALASLVSHQQQHFAATRVCVPHGPTTHSSLFPELCSSEKETAIFPAGSQHQGRARLQPALLGPPRGCRDPSTWAALPCFPRQELDGK